MLESVVDGTGGVFVFVTQERAELDKVAPVHFLKVELRGRIPRSIQGPCGRPRSSCGLCVSFTSARYSAIAPASDRRPLSPSRHDGDAIVHRI